MGICHFLNYVSRNDSAFIFHEKLLLNKSRTTLNDSGNENTNPFLIEGHIMDPP